MIWDFLASQSITAWVFSADIEQEYFLWHSSKAFGLPFASIISVSSVWKSASPPSAVGTAVVGTGQFARTGFTKKPSSERASAKMLYCITLRGADSPETLEGQTEGQTEASICSSATRSSFNRARRRAWAIARELDLNTWCCEAILQNIGKSTTKLAKGHLEDPWDLGRCAYLSSLLTFPWVTVQFQVPWYFALSHLSLVCQSAVQLRLNGWDRKWNFQFSLGLKETCNMSHHCSCLGILFVSWSH